MNTELRSPILNTTYDTDYVLWVEQTLAQLQAGEYDRVDWPNLFEEIEDMSRRQKDALESNLIVLLLHLLKWRYQPEIKSSSSWKFTIRDRRRRIDNLLKTSPSLRPYLLTIGDTSYGEARLQASDETGLGIEIFPEICEWPIEQILQDDFLPEV
jgi:hypothetical protein